ncbi:MAG: ABC transporter permease [Stackebrandtia sp.]
MLAVIRSEWVKTRSTRATMWTVSLTLLLTTAMAGLLGFAWRSSDMAKDESAMRFAGFYPLTLGQMFLVVFAILLIGSEFSSGSIRSSLIAVPKRGRYFAGKFVSAGLVLLVVAVATVALSQVAVQLALGDYAVSIDDSELRLAVLGACAYLPLIGLFAMGLTALLRSSIGALAILMPLLFLNSQGFGNIPYVKEVAQYLPDNAGQSLMRMVPETGRFSHDYGPLGALFILLAWTAAAVIGGYLVTRRKEA